MHRIVALIGAVGLLGLGLAAAEAAPAKGAKPQAAGLGAKAAKAAHRRAAPAGHVETGIASIYCFRNGKTASGERARPFILTAAHKTLPFGTLVEVTNHKNGRAIVVRINDRGPFIKGRIIDLTPAGARALKFDGLTNVTVRVLDHRRDSRIVASAI